MKRKPTAKITLDLGGLGQWPVDVEASILRRLEEQTRADGGRFVLEEPAQVRRLGKYLGNALSNFVRREFAAPTPAQRRFAEAIASRLALEVPSETWESKALLSDFIAAHKARFEAIEEGEQSRPGPRRI